MKVRWLVGTNINFKHTHRANIISKKHPTTKHIKQTNNKNIEKHKIKTKLYNQNQQKKNNNKQRQKNKTKTKINKQTKMEIIIRTITK